MTGAVTALPARLGGRLGAALRFVLDAPLRPRTSSRYPVATTVINLTGSLLLGLLTGLTARNPVADATVLVLGAGVFGGYTTFSTASFETVQLLENRASLAARPQRHRHPARRHPWPAALGYLASTLG